MRISILEASPIQRTWNVSYRPSMQAIHISRIWQPKRVCAKCVISDSSYMLLSPVHRHVSVSLEIVLVPLSIFWLTHILTCSVQQNTICSLTPSCVYIFANLIFRCILRTSKPPHWKKYINVWKKDVYPTPFLTLHVYKIFQEIQHNFHGVYLSASGLGCLTILVYHL